MLLQTLLWSGLRRRGFRSGNLPLALFTLPLVGRVANAVSGVGVRATKALYEYPHPDPLCGSTLPTRGGVK